MTYTAKTASGEGVVGRFGGSIVLAPSDSTIVDAVLDLAREADRDHAAAPGKFLPRKVAGVVSQSDDVPTLAVLSMLEDGLAVLLVGDVSLTLVDGSGTTTLSGRDATTWVDKIVREPWSSLTVSLPGAGGVDKRSDFQGGVLTAAGVELTNAGAPAAAAAPAAPVAPEPVAAEPVAPEPVAPPVLAEPEPVVAEPVAVEPVVAEPVAPPVVPEPEPVMEAPAPPPAPPAPPAPPVVEPAPFESFSLSEPVEAEPLPVADTGHNTIQVAAVTEEPAAQEAAEGAVVVQGIECSRQHFNDPTAVYCAVCGISMVHQTHNLVSGPRPPLGVIVLDDGAVYSLAGDFVLGREPDNAPEVLSGAATPLTLDDPEVTMSRVHARLQLVNWDVQLVDAGSANGTYFAKPGDAEWTKVGSGETVVLKPGAKVSLGGRTFVFDSHHKL